MNDEAAPPVDSREPDDPSDTEPTDEPGAARLGQGRTALVDRPQVRTFLGITGFLIAVAGLLVAVWVNFVRTPPDADGQTESSAGATSPTATATPEQPSNSQSAPAVGQCLDADWALTGCDATHHWEVIGVGVGCGPAEVLAHLGGVPEIDVLTPEAAAVVHTVGGRETCVLGSPGGGPLEGTVRDALQSPGGDIWRRCVDDRVAREVSCAEPHTAEVVGPPVTGELNCPAQADLYAETSLARFGLDLSVASRGPEGAQQCVVEVRGENLLARSLRHLSAAALPIEPD